MPRPMKSMLAALLLAALAIAATGCGSSDDSALLDCIGSERKHGEDILEGTCEPGRALERPTDLVVSPDGRNIYVAAQDANAIAVLARDPESGSLAQRAARSGCVSVGGTKGTCEDGRALRAPSSVAVSPDGRNVYAASQDSSAIVVFDRDPATGALTQKAGAEGCVSHAAEESCAPGEALKLPRAIAISPDGRQVYVAAGGSRAVAVFDRDRVSGALTQKRGANGCISEDRTETTCRRGRALGFASDLVVSRDGRSLYVAAEGSDAVAVFSRDLKAGTLTQDPGPGGCVSQDGSGGDCSKGRALKEPTAVAVSPDGSSVYVGSSGSVAIASGSQGIAIFDRDRRSGRLTQKSGDPGCITERGSNGRCQDGRAVEGVNAIAVSPDGETVYAASYYADGLAIFHRSEESGELTQIPGTVGCFSNPLYKGCRNDVILLGLPTGLGLSPDGKNAYVLGPTFEGRVLTFHRTLADGTLHTSVRGLVDNE